MHIEGGCYCGKVRYEYDGEIAFKGQCHCRECQYVSGGGPNYVVALPEAGFKFTSGQPKTYRRDDLDNPVTRHFCADCGTQLATTAPAAPGIMITKVGTLDQPSLYDKPDHAIWIREMQAFHHVPEGVPTFEGFPVHD